MHPNESYMYLHNYSTFCDISELHVLQFTKADKLTVRILTITDSISGNRE